jgi:hypothetical protein
MSEPEPNNEANINNDNQINNSIIPDEEKLKVSTIDWWEYTPRISITEDNKNVNSTTRSIERDLTPNNLEPENPEVFEFSHIHTDHLPTGVQYTPEFDPNWVYPSGSSDGGRQDDTPVQGLEIGVISTSDKIEPTVRAVLKSISTYYDETGQYPRHRFIKSADVFEDISTDSIGLISVIQPGPDDYSGLMEHINAVKSGADGAINSNINNCNIFLQYLSKNLLDMDLNSGFDNVDTAEVTGWESGDQICSLPVIERYAPLGGSKVYDPHKENIDLQKDGYESVTDASITPQRLSINSIEELLNDFEC